MKNYYDLFRATIYVALIPIIITSCKSEYSNPTSYFSNLETLQSTGTNDLWENLKLDTIIISYPNGVGRGFSQIVDGELLFFDRLRAEVTQITNDFELGKQLLTRGNGPNEIPNFQSFAFNENQKILLKGWTFYCYDKNWNYLNTGTISFEKNNTIKELSKSPKADMIGIYEVEYYENELIFLGDNVLTKITSPNPKLNFAMHKQYYEEARIAAEVNVNTFEIEKILGRKPPIYTNYSFIPHHDFHYWDINSSNEIYLSYEPDSLIYICDENLIPKKAFGVAGINMLQDYYETTTYEDYESYWFLAQTTKGYYKHLKVIEEDNLVFRTYNQGTNELTYGYGDNPKRLQIYKDFELIADVSVPSFFKVIGKMGEYYYADGSAENRENEEIVLYRFKLNDQ